MMDSSQELVDCSLWARSVFLSAFVNSWVWQQAHPSTSILSSVSVAAFTPQCPSGVVVTETVPGKAETIYCLSLHWKTVLTFTAPPEGGLWCERSQPWSHREVRRRSQLTGERAVWKGLGVEHSWDPPGSRGCHLGEGMQWWSGGRGLSEFKLRSLSGVGGHKREA